MEYKQVSIEYKDWKKIKITGAKHDLSNRQVIALMNLLLDEYKPELKDLADKIKNRKKK